MPGLRFAGALFQHKETASGISTFVSDDLVAQEKIETLEKMGVAGVWQALGETNVRIANSGPPGERVSIRVELPDGKSVRDCARALRAIGIEVRSPIGEIS